MFEHLGIVETFRRTLVHTEVCLTKGPHPLPHRILHRMLSSANSFMLRYFLSPSGHTVATSVIFLVFPSVLTSIFPKITCYRRQFLRKMWPTDLASLPLIVCTKFLSSFALRHTSSFFTRSVQLIFSSIKFQNFPATSDLLSEVSDFQHHTKPCSKAAHFKFHLQTEAQFARENNLLV